jgi:hypothetical protein
MIRACCSATPNGDRASQWVPRWIDRASHPSSGVVATEGAKRGLYQRQRRSVVEGKRGMACRSQCGLTGASMPAFGGADGNAGRLITFLTLIPSYMKLPSEDDLERRPEQVHETVASRNRRAG